MELWELLGIRPGLTAVIGSGGKTSLLRVLAQELSRHGTVLLATTTHIMRPNWCPFAATAAELCDGFAHSPIVCAGSYNPEGKLTAPDFPGWQYAADFVLVEADGSRRLPLKAHAPHEPVIPPNARRTVYVVGADGFGHPIRQVCHRPERYAALCGAAEDNIVTPALEARVLHAEGYADGWVFINKVETAEDWRSAEALAALLPGKVLAGSLRERVYRGL